jgi:membrane protein implicated in regulation of membrane protease activity
MRRIDAIALTGGVFLAGGAIYALFQAVGLDSASAGIWAQFVLVMGLLGWVSTYAYRALTQTMTYNQQRRDYEDAVLQRRYEELTPEELAKIEAEIAAEKLAQKTSEAKSEG